MLFWYSIFVYYLFYIIHNHIIQFSFRGVGVLVRPRRGRGEGGINTLPKSPTFRVTIEINIFNNNNNIIYLYCRHTVHIHIKKMLNIYKNSNKNNNNIISQSKIVLINRTLISTIAEWESEYKQ